jgi:hypothetical protein
MNRAGVDFGHYRLPGRQAERAHLPLRETGGQ